MIEIGSIVFNIVGSIFCKLDRIVDGIVVWDIFGGQMSANQKKAYNEQGSDNICQDRTRSIKGTASRTLLAPLAETDSNQRIMEVLDLQLKET